MLGTFGLRPKATMSARALGIAAALRKHGWRARIATVPWDSPEDAGTLGCIGGIEYLNTRAVRPAFWPLAVGELVRQSREFRPDVVHLFKPKGFGDLAARLLRRSGLPIVVDMDDWEGDGGWNDVLPYGRLQRRLFDWQERSWPARASAVTVASKTLFQRALELGATVDRVTYVPNGLGSQRFDELTNPPDAPFADYPDLPVDGQNNILLYTRFVEFDPSFAVQVLSLVTRSIPDTRLVVAGGSADGSAEKRLSWHAEKAGVADRIALLGWIDPRDLGWIASRCSAALVPFDDTLINRAKCSVKLLELITCGLPVVASSVGENREYLRDFDQGFLARPGDPVSHASALESLLAIPHAVNQRLNDRQSVAKVAERYRWERLVTKVLHSYEYALGAE